MFPITRLSAKFATAANKVVKNAAKGNIKPTDMSATLKDFYETVSPEAPKYTKNIFKRAINWVKYFVKSFKAFCADVKDSIQEKKTEFEKLGKKFTKKDKKEVKKETASAWKKTLKDIKEEIKLLINKAKKAPEGEAAANATPNAASNAAANAETVVNA